MNNTFYITFFPSTHQKRKWFNHFTSSSIRIGSPTTVIIPILSEMDHFKIVITVIILNQVIADDNNLDDDLEVIMEEVINPSSLIGKEYRFNSRKQNLYPYGNTMPNHETLAPFYKQQNVMPEKTGGVNQPVTFPLYMMPQRPLAVPMRTYFEPVVHNHPPIHELKKLIAADKKKRKRKYYKNRDFDSSDSDSSSTN